MRDPEIRAAFTARLSKAHRGREHLLVGEVDLRDSARRIDLLLVSSELTAVEVKSDVDTLRRLPGQADAYSRIADKALIVTGARHLDAALGLLPQWWGVWVATPTVRQRVALQCIRRPGKNTSVDPRSLTDLLLRDELLAELRWYDVPRLSSRSVDDLRDDLADRLALGELKSCVREALLRRQLWRDRALSFEPPAGWISPPSHSSADAAFGGIAA